MQQFTQLYFDLDATTRTAEKVRALASYFAAAAPREAAWALYFLIGRKIKRAVPTKLLREWTGDVARLPSWIVDESYHAVGDLAETLALLLPKPEATTSLALHELVEQRLVPLPAASVEQQRELVLQTWRELDARQRLVWHKLITGEFRVGVARTLVARALAAVASVPPAVMSHRLMGHWTPTAAGYAGLVQAERGDANPAQPYPFFLAHPLEGPVAALGEVADWQVEWKWDGIRAQLIRRQGQVLIWSRGEELISDQFPEIAEAGPLLDDGTVLDGEVMAWRDEQPLPFAVLQQRINRKTVSAKLRETAPTAFVAYDLLEHEGRDVRSWPLAERREVLKQVIARVSKDSAIRLSPLVNAGSWEEIERLRAESRNRLVEGLMLKRRGGAYGVGRPKGEWWKWKIAPHTIDAVLIYAQRGHGRRASLYTDYTFGVWNDGALVPIAKAYSGLTDEEIRQVDQFVRRNSVDKFGPVRVVRPELVFELHFEGIQLSKRHKAGLAVRFPRMGRWRHDKTAAEADTLAALQALASSVGVSGAESTA
jgi:DNA ligase 1